MERRARKLTATALLTTLFTALLTTTLAAQAAPPARAEPARPLLSADCATWKAYFQALIRFHERAGGLSTAALTQALDLSYAEYARCVMCGTESAVAVREAIQIVLQAGRTLAAAEPMPRNAEPQ